MAAAMSTVTAVAAVMRTNKKGQLRPTTSISIATLVKRACKG